MPAPLDEQIRRKVIQQWFNGLPRDKIAEDNNIGAGSVSMSRHSQKRKQSIKRQFL
jgi:hypothetical protein